jgi:hypothetical protein
MCAIWQVSGTSSTRRGASIAGASEQAVSDIFKVHRFHVPRLLGIVPAESVTGDLEHPSTKQCAISILRCLAVNDKHYFLRQVFSRGKFAIAR